MRYFLLILIGLNLVSCYTEKPPVNHISEPALVLPYKAGDPVIISAHRGGKLLDGFPENCLETMDYLNRQGIEFFEVDINKTKDDILVLLHDNSLERTTTGVDRLKKYSYAQLMNFYLKDAQGNATLYRIPKLEQVFHWLNNRECILQLDLKGDVSISELVTAIEKSAVENRVILIATSLEQAQKMHKRNDALMISVNIRNEQEYNQLMNSSLPLDRLIAFTGTKLSDPELYKKINQQGLKCILGTLGNLDRNAIKTDFEPFRSYIDMGVDVLATDMPLKALKHVGHLKTN
jgi:glycerophosphoryl diester phosphodiesterase